MSISYGQVDTTTVNAKAYYSNGELYLTFTNNGEDTIYLFSSYLDSQRSKLRYLYRVNQRLDTVKISFLPIIPLLYCSSSSLRGTFTYKSPENENETLLTEAIYSFIAICPKQTKDLVILIQDVFNKSSYIIDEEVDIKNMHINSVIKRPNPINVCCCKINNYILEFAVYKSINNINLEYYVNCPWQFDNLVKDYSIISVSLLQQL